MRPLPDNGVEPRREPDVALSVVIPVYNSAQSLRTLVEQLVSALGRTGEPFELILVDDGSRDESWAVLREQQAARPDQVVAIQLMRNYGQHNAIMCGFRHARGKYVVTMDDDLQHPPEEVFRLLEAIRSRELDLLYGCYQGKKHSPWRNLGSRLVNSFYRFVFQSPVMFTAFRIIRRELVESILTYHLNFTFIDGLLAWNTQRIGELPVEHRARPTGRSSYSLRKLFGAALNMFTNFSLLPLQLTSICGLVVALAGFGLTVYYLVQYLLANIAVPGYASLIIAVLVLGGLQLLALGIIGEYLGRLHLNVNRKPQYTVRHVHRGRARESAGPSAGREQGDDPEAENYRPRSPACSPLA